MTNPAAVLIALALALIASPSAARDLAWRPDATEACLLERTGAEQRELCIGVSAAACINAPGAYATVGFTFCYGQEADYWDRRLNAAYGSLLEREKAVDAEVKDLGASGPSMADALRDMQRAWIVFRDAACAYEASQFGTGTGKWPAAQECRMRMTGRQALSLEQRLAEKAQ